MPIKDFGRIFGLAVEHNRFPGEGHNNSEIWGKLTGNSEPPNMQHLHASAVQHPIPIVFFQFMGFTIFGKEENQNVRSTELEVIGGYMMAGDGYRMNLAHHLASHLLATATSRYKTSITLGGLITHIVIAVANFAERDHTAVPGSNLLDLDYFARIFKLYSKHLMLRPGLMS